MSKSLDILLLEQGCQTPGLQAPSWTQLRTEVKTENEGGRRNLNQIIFAQQVGIAMKEIEVSFGLVLSLKLSPQELGRAKLLGWTLGTLVTHLDHGGHSGDYRWQQAETGLQPPTLLSPGPTR